MEIRQIAAHDLHWIRQTLTDHWGSTSVVVRGRVYHADRLQGFVAVDRNENIGLVTHSIDGDECEIVTLNSLKENQGIGTALLNAVVAVARHSKCRYIVLVTTNDNHRAMRFYQMRGFALKALHRDSMEQARKQKPEIPLMGIDGIPIRDEIEMELKL